MTWSGRGKPGAFSPVPGAEGRRDRNPRPHGRWRLPHRIVRPAPLLALSVPQARATAEQAEAALAYLSAIDPLMFEIAMDAADLVVGVAPRDEAAGDDEAVPVCRRCGAQGAPSADSVLPTAVPADSRRRAQNAGFGTRLRRWADLHRRHMTIMAGGGTRQER